MKKLTVLTQVLLTAISLAASIAWPQEPPVTAQYDTKNNWFVFEWMNPETGKKQAIYDSSNKVKPVIHAHVSAEEKTDVYTYYFGVSNLQGALQVLEEIFIPHPSAIFDSANPSTEWSGDEYRNQGIWTWHRIGKIHGIPAGKGVSGFSFKSKGLPAIVTASFAGERRVEYTIPSPDNDPEDVQSSFEKVFSDLEKKYPDKFVDRVQLKTVGPVDPPANFVALDFIQNLRSLEGQSVSLGWISNQGIANSLAAKLDETKKKVAACKIKTATNLIHAFVDEVRETREHEERGDKVRDKDDRREHHEKLTSDGFAVLFYNGKYLLTQLEKKTNLNCPTDHDRDDDDHDADDGKKKDR